MRERKRELSLRMNEAGCRAISTPPEQILQTKPANRNRFSDACACIVQHTASRPKIIYRRIARAARGAASDNARFAIGSFPCPFIGLSKLSGPVVCAWREHGSEIHEYDKRSLVSLFVCLAREAGKLFSNRRSRLHTCQF